MSCLLHRGISCASGHDDVDVVVVGAGCGGLSAAALLAGQGRRVLVLDQNNAVGGCASSFERKGYAFDVAASIFEVLEPLQRTLTMLGTSIEEEMELLPCDPACAVRFIEYVINTCPRRSFWPRGSRNDRRLRAPLDFERRIGLAEGGLHGITQDVAQTTVFRPSNKSKSIDGLYLTGSSTHPGGGVPTVIASGAIAAKLIERHED
jgi:phytoene dehydrogenase-like protein